MWEPHIHRTAAQLQTSSLYKSRAYSIYHSRIAELQKNHRILISINFVTRENIFKTFFAANLVLLFSLSKRSGQVLTANLEGVRKRVHMLGYQNRLTRIAREHSCVPGNWYLQTITTQTNLHTHDGSILRNDIFYHSALFFLQITCSKFSFSFYLLIFEPLQKEKNNDAYRSYFASSCPFISTSLLSPQHAMLAQVLLIQIASQSLYPFFR